MGVHNVVRFYLEVLKACVLYSVCFHYCVIILCMCVCLVIPVVISIDLI